MNRFTDPKKPSRRAAARKQERAFIPLPAEAVQDEDAMEAAERQLQHWLDEAILEYERNGGFDNLPGKGKPLKVPTGNVLEGILKNAGASPPWVMLRKETQKSMERAVRLMERNAQDPEIDELIEEMNRNIEEMNAGAPSLSLYRLKLSRSTLLEQYPKWK